MDERVGEAEINYVVKHIDSIFVCHFLAGVEVLCHVIWRVATDDKDKFHWLVEFDGNGR